MHRIGVISDTHGLLRKEVLQILSGCEVILHGGDIDHLEVIERLKQIAPVYVVRGNNDKECKKRISKEISDFDMIIYGHSHRYEESKIGQQLWLNPGSCGPRRFQMPITMAILEITEDHNYQVKQIELFQKTFSKEKEIPNNIRQVIGVVIKEIEHKKTIEEIAKRNKISPKLVEQICRLYLTHPGINIDGIIKKMELL